MTRIAYIISAYKYPGQLIRLIYRLHVPTSVFIVHVDKNTDRKQYREMLSGVDHFTNVIFLKRHACHWGDFGHVRATLKGLAYLCRKKIDFDYLFLLTGQDYPIKSNREIQAFLQNSQGKEFVAYRPLPRNDWPENGGLGRLEYWHFRVFNRFVRLPSNRKFASILKSTIYSSLNAMFNKRTLPGSMKPFGGPGYWCITRECATFVNTYVKRNVKFVKFFKYVDIPDEIFFHTIILNSPFRENVINDDLRCIDWSDEGRPGIWRKPEFETLAQSRGLIARKFDAAVDSEILDLIDLKLLSNP